MKLHKLLIILSIGIAYSCASSNTTSVDDYNQPDEEVSTPYLELADYLRRVPGVTVNKRGSSYAVMVRGASTITGTNEPLFVIDRTQVGGYEEAASLVDPNDIDRVEVLKDVGSTSPYGMRGANGVIIIHTKK